MDIFMLQVSIVTEWKITIETEHIQTDCSLLVLATLSDF